MAFSFPTSPTLNQVYTFGTKTWRFNGTGWVLVTGVDAAQSAWSTANLAYVNSNAATVLAQGAYDTANSKFDKAGGTITGNVFITRDLSIGGNVTVLGNTFSVNAGSIQSNSTVLLLGIGNYTTDIIDVGFAGHYNAGVNAHTGLIRDSGTKEWYLFKGYVPEIVANNNIILSDPSFRVDTLNANLRSNNIVLNGSDLNSYINSAYYQANSGFIQANSGYIHANAAFVFANSLAGGLNTVNVSIDFSNDKINAAFNHANSGFIQANSGFIHANAAFNAANNALDTWVRGQANAAFIQANTSSNTGQSAFIQANSAFIHANAAFNAANNALDTWVRGQANAAFVKANSGFIHANAAFDFANTLSGGAAIDNVARITANSGFIQANAAFLQANTPSYTANSAASYANAAFLQANSGFFHANAAFIRANNSLDANNGGSVSGTILSTANVRADYVVANTGFASAAGLSKLSLSDIGIVAIDVASQQFKFGAAGIESNPGIYGGTFGGNKLSLNNETNLRSERYDVVKIQTGTDGTTPNEWVFSNNSLTAPGGITANGFTAGGINVVPTLSASYVRANNSLDANNGGTVTGDVRITGNLTVTGNTTYVNTSQVLIADNIITLNAAINQASAPTVDAGIEVDRGSSANVYMLWNETQDRWTFTNDGNAYEGVGYASTAPYANAAFTVANGAFFHANAAFSAQNVTGQYANSAFAQANGAFIVANAASLQANSAFFHANGAFSAQNATGQYANSAFIQANSAYIHANASFIWANASFNQANAAFTVANGAFFHANAGFVIANVALLQANAAFQVANVAILQANSAFFHANAAFITANSGFIQANYAFEAANSAGVYANSAYRHANAAFITGNSAFTQANAAFLRANNSLNSNTGGTVTGNVVVIGNVVADAFQTSGPAGDITGANAIFANYIFGANGSIDLTIWANNAYANANAGFAKANGAYNVANAAFLQANSGFIAANSGFIQANSGFIQANYAFESANSAGVYANNAYRHANAAFDYANNATGAVVTFGTQPPASGNSNGHIWVDSTDGTEYMYFKDSDTFQWVEFGPTSSNVSMNTYINADITSSYNHANAAFNKANSSITSDRLSSNLAINIIRVLETANIYSTAVGGNVNIDISNNTSYFFSSNTTANVTFNLRANGNAGGIYDSLVNIGQTSTVAIALKQGSTRYKANLYIDGILQTLYWLGNSAPDYATTQPQTIDVYSFVVFKTAANTYSVLAANSNFGLAQGQPGQG